MGIPPFGGFFGKYMVISGAVAGGQPWISLVFIIGAILTIIYLLRVFVMVFMGQPRMEGVREGSKTMLVSISALAALSLAAGILVYYPSALVQTVITQMAVVLK